MPSDYLEISWSLSMTFNELHLVNNLRIFCIHYSPYQTQWQWPLIHTSEYFEYTFETFLSRRFCKGHKHPREGSWSFGCQGSGPAQSQCSWGWPLLSGDPGERLPGAMGLNPVPGRCFQLRLSPWSCQSSSSNSCHPAVMCLVMGPTELQPPAGQHPSLGTQGGAWCPRPGLHLLQRLHHEFKLNTEMKTKNSGFRLSLPHQ